MKKQGVENLTLTESKGKGASILFNEFVSFDGRIGAQRNSKG